MLDAQNPEIDVDKIMQQIQEKLRNRALPSTTLRAPALLSSPGPAWLPLENSLARAQQSWQVGAALPPMGRMRGLKRVLAQGIGRLYLRISQVITRGQRTFNQSILESLRELSNRVREGADVEGRLEAGLSKAAVEIAALRDELATSRARLTEVGAAQDALLRRTHEAEARSAEHARLEALKLAPLRTSISLQERRLTGLLEEVRSRLAGKLDEGQAEALAEVAPRVSDAMYLGFEDAFRGPRDEIKRRVQIYAPMIRAAGAGSPDAPVLDAGCGRGELLEVLRDEGLVGTGVDSNQAAVELCRGLGLQVALGDLFDYLQKVPDGSLGAVASLHVVEHLPFPVMLRLLDEAIRVLRPGGIAIFESPNPTNVLVGATNFYIDPTHNNPVHPSTLQFLAEARGLVRVEVLPLHPCPAESRIPEQDSMLAKTFNDYFFGPRDYAVVGYRA